MHVASLTSKMTIYLARKAQIALLLAKEVTILSEYADFLNVFLKELAKVMPEPIDINGHAIELEENKQPSYKSIYNLGQVELKTLKIYIETNLANGFIRSLKSPTSALILFV